MTHLRVIEGGLGKSPMPVSDLPQEVIAASRRLAAFLKSYNSEK